MKLFYTDKAREDIELAFEWYEKQRRGLGFEFLDSIESSLLNIIKFPQLHPVRHLNFRGSVIRRFPFTIFYTIEDETIAVHSVFHNRQNPRKLPEE